MKKAGEKMLKQWIIGDGGYKAETIIIKNELLLLKVLLLNHDDDDDDKKLSMLG